MTTKELKNKLEQTLEFFSGELTKVKTGKANPSMLESVKVMAYGAQMKIQELATISVLDAHNLIVAPWDKSVIEEIEKALLNSDLNVNPVNDGDKIRIPFPSLTEDRRKDLAKVITAKLEESKQTLRNLRQTAMKFIDKEEKDGNISEDYKYTLKEEVEKLVSEYKDKLQSKADAKKEDILNL
jgi:ribosome recycling factor